MKTHYEQTTDERTEWQLEILLMNPRRGEIWLVNLNTYLFCRNLLKNDNMLPRQVTMRLYPRQWVRCRLLHHL